MSVSAGTPGSSSNETSPAPAATVFLPGLDVTNQSPPPQDSSPPSGESPPSPPPSSSSSDNGNSTSTSSPSPPPPSNSESSAPPSPPPPPPSKKSPPPSPPSDSPPPKASPTPPPPTPTSSSSSSSPPSPPPRASSNQQPPLSSPPPPPPPDDNTQAPPSNENTTPPPSKGSKSPPPPPPAESIAPPSPPTESSQSPNSSTSTVITSPGPKSATSPPHRGTPNLGPPSNTKSEADSPTSPSSNDNTEKTVVGVAVAGAFLITLIAIFFVACKRRKRRRVDVYATHYMPPSSFSVKSDGYYHAQQQSMVHSGPQDPYQPPTHSQLVNSSGSQRGQMYHGGGPDSGVIGGGKTFFSYEELMDITGGFSRQNILGEGGFGCVYKGWLPDGRVVAVKQLKAGSGQGEREFRAEVEIISRVHHRYLVSLVGYCISESHRLLIYEFVPNRTLEQHLHEGSMVLDWPKRVKIAIGAAKGLAYLHEDCHPKIIHRDIKSANILLDDDFEAQVADFGLAKLNDSTQTHVSTRVMGTFGYMAPEYASSGKLTDRSDVFSFGVVLLELITGRKPVDPTQPLGDESLVEWARPLLVHALETGDFSELVDPRLQKHYMESEVFRMIEAAAACVRHSAPKRPRMVQVVRALDSEAEMSDLSNGVRYGQSTAYDSGQYNQDIMKFRRMALGSDVSSEYGMQSGEYTTKEVSHGFPNSWKSSSEFTSGESETRAMTGHSGSQGNYVAPRF